MDDSLCPSLGYLTCTRRIRTVRATRSDSPWSTDGQSMDQQRTVRNCCPDIQSLCEILQSIRTVREYLADGPCLLFLSSWETLIFLANLVYQLGSFLNIFLNTSTNTIESTITIIKMSRTKILSYQDEDVHLWPYVPWLILHFSYQSSSISHSHI
jgi:hypothetical protein